MARHDAERDVIWEKGAEVPALDPCDWRVDHLCRLMRYGDFGLAGAEYGWTICEIDGSLLDLPLENGATAAPVAFATLRRNAA